MVYTCASPPVSFVSPFPEPLIEPSGEGPSVAVQARREARAGIGGAKPLPLQKKVLETRASEAGGRLNCLRNTMRQQRRAILESERVRACRAITRQLHHFLDHRGASTSGKNRIATFWPSDGEVAVQPATLPRQAHWYLPAGLAPFRSAGFQFWRSNLRNGGRDCNRRAYGLTTAGYRGIRVVRRGRRLRASEIDVALVPVVAVDSQGHRVGRGGGWYDRMFGPQRWAPGGRRPWLIGIGWDFQRVKQVPHQPWDMRLDALVTEVRIEVFPKVKAEAALPA